MTNPLLTKRTLQKGKGAALTCLNLARLSIRCALRARAYVYRGRLVFVVVPGSAVAVLLLLLLLFHAVLLLVLLLVVVLLILCCQLVHAALQLLLIHAAPRLLLLVDHRCYWACP